MENARIVKHLGKDVHYIDGLPCFVKEVHENWASVTLINEIDFTLEDAVVAKINGYFAHATTLKKAFTEANNKYMKSLNTDDIIEEFKKKYPSITDTATAQELSDWHNNLTGSCSFGREQFAKDHSIGMKDMLTIEEFLNLTKGSYGSEIIHELESSYA